MIPSAPGVAVVPVRTPTLPPATHTNTWVVGEGALTIVDPASPWEDEQHRLAAALDERIAGGERIQRLVLTHHHHDHVSGAVALQDHLAARHGERVPIVAHPVTAELVAHRMRVDETWTDLQRVDAGGRSLEVLFTPGHAPGHIALRDMNSSAVIMGDLVAGVGTIALEPSEADLQDYLDALERVRALAPTALLPAHGPVLEQADAVLQFYVAHRHQRSEQIRVALDRLGSATPLDLAPEVYPDLDRAYHPLAAAQITTHLRWLAHHGLVTPSESEARWSAG